MPSALELVFINEQPVQIDTVLIEQQLQLSFARLNANEQTANTLQQSVGVDRLVTEIVFVGDKKIKALNAQFRGVDAPTDVLSFERNGDNPDYPASVVISLDTATRQAELAGWSVSQEVVSLANHGLLHILGYSHT